MLKLPPGEGVLPNHILRDAVEAGMIAADDEIPERNVQPASLDLRLGEVAYRIRCSFLPDRQTVERTAQGLSSIDELDLRKDGVVLETKRPYLIPLKERLALPPGMRGKANPKSSTGRIDVFTRVITDESYRFDEIADGYEGPLFLEVVPLSFPVRVREDLTLNQLRLSVGRARARRRRHPRLPPRSSRCSSTRASRCRPRSSRSATACSSASICAATPQGRVGYRARDNAPLLDVTKSRAPVDAETVLGDRCKREDGDRVVLTPAAVLSADDATRP